VLFFGLLALPWVASGFFFYYALHAAPAASLYQAAPACAADASTGNHCLQLVRGTVVNVNRRVTYRSASYSDDLSIELPTGTQSARVTTFVVPPPSWLQIGQTVDVTLYDRTITHLSANGLQTDTDDNPVVHEHDLIITGLIALGFGIVLDGGIFIPMRRKKKAPGLAAS
jgi:hypothetical protein